MSADTVLILRTCDENMRSYGGFTWPTEGPVDAPDWKPTASCGNGLHGLLFGEGDGGLLNWDPEARWLVVEVPAASIVSLDGKVKYPAGTVVHCGDRLSATEFLRADPRAAGRAITGGTATAGDEGTATAGYRGTATAGDEGTLIIHWYDAIKGRYRVSVTEVGVDDIEPNVAYRLDADGRFVKAPAPQGAST